MKIQIESLADLQKYVDWFQLQFGIKPKCIEVTQETYNQLDELAKERETRYPKDITQPGSVLRELRFANIPVYLKHEILKLG